MTTEQNIIERIKDKLKRGLITADEANVQIVEDLRFRVITNRLDMATRKALNNAVKKGRLERIKKDGLRPEVYYKTNFRHLAIQELNRIELRAKNAIKNICA